MPFVRVYGSKGLQALRCLVNLHLGATLRSKLSMLNREFDEIFDKSLWNEENDWESSSDASGMYDSSSEEEAKACRKAARRKFSMKSDDDSSSD